jgi:hypothetical protein
VDVRGSKTGTRMECDIEVQTNVGPETGQIEECTASDGSASVKEGKRIRVRGGRKEGKQHSCAVCGRCRQGEAIQALVCSGWGRT